MKRNEIDFSDVMPKTIEEVYQKKTPIEHVLLRPDTYIGSVERETFDTYVWDETLSRIVLKKISFVPGLYKIFDEIIVNAADNKIRDSKMKKIEVNVKDDVISVYNDGKGVPVVIHDKEKVYVPEMIFGQLLTSSNYDDNEKKVTGGRNGYGAKLCNIFSTEFTVETSDCSSGKSFKQHFKKNMGVTEKPILGTANTKDFTRITFKPDLKRFGMEKLDDDFLALIKKRVIDLSGTVKGVSVFLNDVEFCGNGFLDYTKMYTSDEIVYGEFGRWQVGVGLSEEDQFQQVSFVNSICTLKGGTHVNHVFEKLAGPITDAIKKKEKNLVIRPFQIKNAMFLFVNCLIENPAFDSQTKETLTLRQSSFGSVFEPSPTFVKAVVAKMYEKVVSFAKAKQVTMLSKTDGTKKSILNLPKLTDAKFAGHRVHSQDCTLILCEGDSASSTVRSGLSTEQLHYYGVFPLKGKLLNVREASPKQIAENEEIINIKKIIGLQHKKVYNDVKELRYGHVMIMTDQDHDGSHIKGLIINFFDHFYPSLLKIDGFLQEFITPILKATLKRTGQRDEVLSFFTIPEFENWKEDMLRRNPRSLDHCVVKYYKGLGTSNAKEAKEYFSNLRTHVKTFQPMTEDDTLSVDLAFSRKKVDDRKVWLQNFVPGTFLDTTKERIFVSEFVNRELILFSMADNMRSIPSVVDGLKPGQRKVIYTMFNNKINGEMKVVQLASKVAAFSSYHHGEASLAATIINLAQDFVGSNNINLLNPNGQFGSRLNGGKDAASPRYIFTELNKLTRLLFRPEDDAVLNYMNEDNNQIEPDFYVPIIPMVLVNGAEGIGTGWSTNIPCYCPSQIAEIYLEALSGNSGDIEQLFKELSVKLKPFYNNFRGRIEEVEDKKYKISGNWEYDDGLITITELPIWTWTEPYKAFLIKTIGEVDFGDLNTDKRVYFSFEVEISEALVEKKLKLSTTTTLNNMVCFDHKGFLKKYEIHEILKEFYDVRVHHYTLRYNHLVAELRRKLKEVENKARFIREVVSNQLVLMKRKRKDIEVDLDERKYDRLENSFDYLLNMAISSLTLERIDNLNKELENKTKELNDLLATPPLKFWENDLRAFLKEYSSVRKAIDEEYETERKVKVSVARKRRKNKKLIAKTKKKTSEEEDESTESSSDEKKKPKKRQKKSEKEPTAKKIKKDGEKPLKAAKNKAITKIDGQEEPKGIENKKKDESDSEEMGINRKKKPWEKLNIFMDDSDL